MLDANFGRAYGDSVKKDRLHSQPSTGVIHAPMKSFGIWVLIALLVVAALGFVLFFGPISRTKDTPLLRAVSRIHQICTKLRHYAEDHSSFPGGATTNGNIDGLVAGGILSADDAAFIRSFQVEYHGFDLRHIAADVPVFETVFTNTKTPCRIVGYSDGHVVTLDLHTKP